MNLSFNIKKYFIFALSVSLISAHAQAMTSFVLGATSFVISLWKRSGLANQKPPSDPPYYEGGTIIGNSTKNKKVLGFDPVVRIRTKETYKNPPIFFLHGYGDKNKNNSECFNDFFKKKIINFNFIDVKNPSIFSHSIGSQKDRNTALLALVQAYRHKQIKNDCCVMGFSRGGATTIGLLHMLSLPEKENYQEFFKSAGITNKEISDLRKILLNSPIVLIHPLLDIKCVTKNIAKNASKEIFGGFGLKFSEESAEESITTIANQFLYKGTDCNPYEKSPIECLVEILDASKEEGRPNLYFTLAVDDELVTNNKQDFSRSL
jgi:hypothetical protein